MERKTALQATGVFVVTVLAGLPFALQVGEWLGGPDGTPGAPAPAATERAPQSGDEPEAADEPRGGTGAGPAPTGGTAPTSSPGPRPAKAGLVPGLPESTPAAPGEPAPGPTGEPEEPAPAEPTGEPEEPEPELPEPTLPIATGGPVAAG